MPYAGPWVVCHMCGHDKILEADLLALQGARDDLEEMSDLSTWEREHVQSH